MSSKAVEVNTVAARIAQLDDEINDACIRIAQLDDEINDACIRGDMFGAGELLRERRALDAFVVCSVAQAQALGYELQFVPADAA